MLVPTQESEGEKKLILHSKKRNSWRIRMIFILPSMFTDVILQFLYTGMNKTVNVPFPN
jgi:hypothetical protein